jgi:hypothetical protein
MLFTLDKTIIAFVKQVSVRVSLPIDRFEIR